MSYKQRIVQAKIQNYLGMPPFLFSLKERVPIHVHVFIISYSFIVVGSNTLIHYKVVGIRPKF